MYAPGGQQIATNPPLGNNGHFIEPATTKNNSICWRIDPIQAQYQYLLITDSMVGHHRHGGRNGLTNFVSNTVDQNCCAFWTNGCGLNPLFRTCAEVLEAVTPVVEQFGNVIWIFGSPLAFPLVFCFSPDPHTKESSGYEISMCEAPCRRPITCCFATLCVPCAQWHARRVVLQYDMSKYKLWQGYHDGPQCCARVCPKAPIIIRSGTYGEQKCPNLFLCLEVYVMM